MGILQILVELAAILKTYGPIAIEAEKFIVAGDWAGLIAYLESLANPPTPMPANQKLTATHQASLTPLIVRLKACVARP